MAAGSQSLKMSQGQPLVVVVTGSECTGKTTLAISLAARFDAPWSREYAREYVALKQAPLDERDVEPIARGQLSGEQAAENEAALKGRPMVVRDTDLLSTTVYSRHYYGTCPDWIASAACQRAGNLYLLLCPDVPWVADGLHRDRRDEAARAGIHTLFREALGGLGATVVEIRGTWGERLAQATAAVTASLNDPR